MSVLNVRKIVVTVEETLTEGGKAVPSLRRKPGFARPGDQFTMLR